MESEIELRDSTTKQANKLIESVYRMEANEQKIILLATKIVYDMEKRKEPFTAETEIVITASDYAREYGVSRQAAFELISEAKNTIYERSFELDYTSPSGEIKPMSSRWIHMKGEMKAKSEISMFFAPMVIPFIYLVEKEFTLLDLKEVGRLKSKYAIRLYKLLMKWRNAEYQPKFEYDDLRKKLGLEEEHPLTADFKKRVLDVAVAQINKCTGFVNLKYKQHKKGVKITHFSFSYDFYDNKTINITPMTSKTSSKATKPANDGDAGDKPKKPSVKPKQADLDLETKVESSLAKPHAKKPLVPGGMTQTQAEYFADLVLKGIDQQQGPAFQAVSIMARPGESRPDFRERVVIDFMAGDLSSYAGALQKVGYTATIYKK